MADRRVAVLAGDGIGPEVIPIALDTLPPGYDIVEIQASAERYLKTGVLLDDSEIEQISDCDALLFGAIGDPRVEDGVLEKGILLRLRRELDLYVNLRPFDELGIVFVRENTEGPYCGLGRRHEDIAIEMNVNSQAAVQRCARFGFELASRRRKRLTLVHKTNVMSHAGALWREVVYSEAESFDEVEVRYEHADAAAYHLVTDPGRFDVILTDNLFGDLLSDLAAGLAGGLGRAASSNLHPDDETRPTKCIGLFEPIHGSAPDIAGKGLADPTATVEAARIMVELLSSKEPIRA
jgi:3-isopropylmalate dehydrogenase